MRIYCEVLCSIISTMLTALTLTTTTTTNAATTATITATTVTVTHHSIWVSRACSVHGRGVGLGVGFIAPCPLGPLGPLRRPPL